jgi:prolipoprotein diacylglyceryl transferase
MPSRASGHLLSFIPSPSIDGFHIGPLFIHFYGLMYVVGITVAIIITRRRWRAMGGNPDLVGDVAIWAVPAGIIGGRIYFDITTPGVIPHVWYGVFAVWTGGLGIWGGIAGGAIAGIWRVRRAGASAGLFANAIAPALLVAQAIGRVGNYFNQELFGKPSTLPWALEISLAHRPAGYLAYSTFQPSFLYELIFDLALAAFLVWLGHHARIKPWGLFALYVAGYSGYRIFEETIRIDYSQYILGLRLNFWVALIMTMVGIGWFVAAQRRPAGPWRVAGPGPAGPARPATALADAPDSSGADNLSELSDADLSGGSDEAGGQGDREDPGSLAEATGVSPDTAVSPGGTAATGSASEA